MNNIIWAVVWFAVISVILGIMLAVASKIFHVKTDTRAEAILDLLPKANCGGCGYTGCGALAEAICKGDAKCNACTVCGNDVHAKISEIMGVEREAPTERKRAQVMCSGTHELTKKKYIYEGLSDCVSAMRLSGGDKLCPNGCIGLGTCVNVCRFDAIKIINGVAAVDYTKCTACGTCVASCPKKIIKLIPYNAQHWVGCTSHDKGPVTKNYCEVGCIGCGLCMKACPVGAIKVKDFVAEIDYSLCTGCGSCESACPRKIIWSGNALSKVRENVRLQKEKDGDKNEEKAE